MLLADIIATRLVILLAKTGTGKSSLINAGVRPRLRKEGYATFWVRVESDPIRSARRVLREGVPHLFSGEFEKKPLSEQMAEAVKALDQPIVLFFDQFEEFFLHRDEGAGGRFETVGDELIKQVGQLYRNPKWDVSLVFSMREEFFHEMDIFRDEIPSIFHNDSMLRLRWFRDDQAREAIVLPARVAGAEFESKLVDRIISDLRIPGRGIEPAQLQIVCDTLWTERYFTLDNSFDERFGGAKGILNSRLERDIENHLSGGELTQFRKIIPSLTHERKQTKLVCAVETLAKDLDLDRILLDALLAKLKDLRLIRESMQHEALYVEWTSDYLAARSAALRTHLFILSARERARMKGTPEASAENSYLSPEEFEELSNAVAQLGRLSRGDAELLFETALEHGSHRIVWFGKARESEMDVWQFLGSRIGNAEEYGRQAAHAVSMLADPRFPPDDHAREFLERALQIPELASLVIEALPTVSADWAGPLLEETLRNEKLGLEVIDALRRVKGKRSVPLLEKTMQETGPFALRAGMALDRIAGDPRNWLAPQAAAAFKRALGARGEEFFSMALDEGSDLRFWFGTAAQSGTDVWNLLHKVVEDPQTPVQRAQHAVRLLGEMAAEDEPRAKHLLDLARRREALVESAGSAIEHAATEVARAQAIRKAKPDIAAPEYAPGGGLTENDWDLLLARISRGRCVPIIGLGALEELLPSPSDIARKWAYRFGYPFNDPENLNRVADFITTQYDSSRTRELLGEELTGNESAGDSKNSVFQVLASLTMPIYVTTNFDDLIIHALKRSHRDPRSVVCRWNDQIPNYRAQTASSPASPANPIVFYLRGNIHHPESMVLGEDIALEWLVGIGRDRDAIPLQVQASIAGGTLLFIGYPPLSLDFKLLCASLSRLSRHSVSNHFAQIPSLQQNNAESSFEDRTLSSLRVSVYRGSAAQFSAELAQRFQAQHGSP